MFYWLVFRACGPGARPIREPEERDGGNSSLAVAAGPAGDLRREEQARRWSKRARVETESFPTTRYARSLLGLFHMRLYASLSIFGVSRRLMILSRQLAVFCLSSCSWRLR